MLPACLARLGVERAFNDFARHLSIILVKIGVWRNLHLVALTRRTNTAGLATSTTSRSSDLDPCLRGRLYHSHRLLVLLYLDVGVDSDGVRKMTGKPRSNKDRGLPGSDGA